MFASVIPSVKYASMCIHVSNDVTSHMNVIRFMAIYMCAGTQQHAVVAHVDHCNIPEDARRIAYSKDTFRLELIIAFTEMGLMK